MRIASSAGGEQIRLPLLGTFALSLLASASPAAASDPRPEPPFVDATAEAGLDFHHFIGATGDLYFAENFGSGVALFDADNDGDLDLYLVQGAMLDDRSLEESIFPFMGTPPPTDRFYRNELVRRDSDVPGSGEGVVRFLDVTEASGIKAPGYGMGVATGDYDGDGFVDLYVTNFGPNQLWRNNGDGTFSERTREAGVDDARWSVPAVFFDYDRDGDLDLFVGNYTNFRVATHKECRAPAGYRDYCAPGSYDPEPDRLFRNRGDGTFEDVTARAGLSEAKGNTLGAIAADFDGDGFLDLFVAIDQMPNFLWRNRGDGTFVEEALVAGCAVNELGATEASMGVDAADFDGDGDLDLFMTHLGQETNTLYVNDSSGGFVDSSLGSGLGNPSWSFTGFGTAFFDYDNDGWLDVLAVNGAVALLPELYHAGDPYPLHQPNLLFRNRGDGSFEEIRAVPALERSEVSRGAAFGDLDNDGDPDVVINNNNGPARVLRNTVGATQAWIGLRLLDGDGRVDRLGARVALERHDGPTLWRWVRVDGSFASARDPRILFGLDGGSKLRRVVVDWPDGSAEEFPVPPLRRYTSLRQGQGAAMQKGGER